jgi:hypothetical protein
VQRARLASSWQNPSDGRVHRQLEPVACRLQPLRGSGPTRSECCAPTQPAGPSTARGTVLLRHPGYVFAYDTAVISPDGSSLYLCSFPVGSTVTSAIAAREIHDGDMKPDSTLATFTGEAGCNVAQLDPSGRWLPIPDRLAPPRVVGPIGEQHRAWGARGKLHLARINTTTGARANLTL